MARNKTGPRENIYDTPRSLRLSESISNVSSLTVVNLMQSNPSDIQQGNKHSDRVDDCDKSNLCETVNNSITDSRANCDESLDTKEMNIGVITTEDEGCLKDSNFQSSKSSDYLPMDGVSKLLSEPTTEDHIYEEIDEDEFDRSPIRSSYPPPPVPRSPRPHKAHCTGSLKPLQMIDATDPDINLPSLASEENMQILITGIPKTMTIKEVETSLKCNLLRRADDLEDIKIERVHDEAVVTLKRRRAVNEVLDTTKPGKKMTFDNTEVNVSLYNQAPIDLYQVFVFELEQSSDDIFLNNDAIFGKRPTKIIKGERHGIALLSFDTGVSQDCLKRYQSKFHKWNILPVKRTKRVRIKGVTPETTRQKVREYLLKYVTDQESIVSLVDRHNLRDFIITFSKLDEAEKVVNQGVHSLNGKEIEISYYYPLLEGDEEYIFNIPQPKKMLNLDKDICWFLQRSSQYRNELERKVGLHHGKMKWPGDEVNDLKYLEVVCNVDERDRNAKIKVQDWEENAYAAVSNVCLKLSVHFRYFAFEIESDLKKEIEMIKVENQDSCCVRFEKNRVILVGETKHVDCVIENIRDRINAFERDLDEKGKLITKAIKLEKYQTEMFVEFNIKELLKNVQSNIDAQHHVVLKGRKSDVDEAISVMKHSVTEFPTENIKDISFRESCFLTKLGARNYVKDRIRESGVSVILKFTEENGLHIYGKTSKDIKSAVRIIKSSIKTTKFTLDTFVQTYLKNAGETNHLDDLVNRYGGKFIYQTQGNDFYIVSIDTLHQEIVGKVKNLLDIHAYVEEVLLFDSGVFLYLFNNNKRDVEQVIEQYKYMNVEIDIIDRETRSGFMIKGEKCKCKLAIAQLNSLKRNIMRTDMDVKDDCFYTFLQSPEGRDNLKIIQLAKKCIIQIPVVAGFASTECENPAESILATSRFGNCEIQILRGDITSLETEFVVNPTDTKLEHKRGLGRTLIDKGGFHVSKSCEEKRLCIKEFDSFVGNAGNLPFRGIIHVVLPTYSPEHKNGTQQDISRAVRNCLLQSENEMATSIAFPLIGRGRFGYPDDIIVETMIKAMENYLIEKGTDTYLIRITICDKENDLISFLPESITKEFSLTSGAIKERERARNSRCDHTDGSKRKIVRDTITGSVTSQDTDVIVNSTNSKLDLKIGKLSRMIVAEGGKDIITELTEKYPNGISPGEIAVSTGGKLKCKAIFHGVLEKWDENQGHSETVMRYFIRECLLNTMKRNFESISFPVLGSGELQFPKIKVTQIMANEIDKFEKEHPATSLKLVRIVKYSNEETTVFEGENPVLRSMDKPSNSSVIYRRCSNRISNVFTSGSTSQCYSKTIDSVTVSIEQGDITVTSAAVIVNSVPENLNLISGRISKAIINAAGNTIQTEANKQMAIFREKQLVMTSSGRMVSCQKIVHLKAKSSKDGWKRVIKKCLAEVEKFSFSSVAFPALGTGGKNFSPSDMGQVMAEAFQEYIHGDNYKQNLKEIKIVLYDTNMVGDFIKRTKATLERFRRKPTFPFWHKHEDAIDSPKMVIHIYTESRDSAVEVKRRIEELRHQMINKN